MNKHLRSLTITRVCVWCAKRIPVGKGVGVYPDNLALPAHTEWAHIECYGKRVRTGLPIGKGISEHKRGES